MMEIEVLDQIHDCFSSSHLMSSSSISGIKRAASPIIEVKRSFESLPVIQNRQVESGFVPILTSATVVMFAESFPIWLVALEPSWVHCLHVHGYESLDDFRNRFNIHQWPNELMERALQRLSLSRVKFYSSSSDVLPADLTSLSCRVILLVSGSLTYLSRMLELLQRFGYPVISSFDHHYGGRLNQQTGAPSTINVLDLPFVTWYRIRHPTVGGTTTFTNIQGTCNIPAFCVPTTSDIRRTLKHVLHYSVRPLCISTAKAHSSVEKRACLSVNDRLRPSNLQQPIIYGATSFCASGWGKRSLTASELADIYGIPVRLKPHIESQPSVFSLLVPIGLLHHWLIPLIRAPVPSVDSFSVPPPAPKRLCPSRHGTTDEIGTWLPTIQKWLPHTWVDASLVTNKAVKADNAGIPVDLWNQRLLLLYPQWSTHHLDSLRTMILRRCRYNLFRSFCAFLTHKFTNHWVYLLAFIRAKALPGHDGGRMGIFCPLSYRFLLSHLDSFADIYHQGIDVLLRWDRCTWWDWSDGSALVFWRWGEHCQLALEGLPPFITSVHHIRSTDVAPLLFSSVSTGASFRRASN